MYFGALVGEYYFINFHTLTLKTVPVSQILCLLEHNSVQNLNNTKR
jgi:hypothetical protein